MSVEAFRFRKLDGRIAIECVYDSGFSHLVYLTSDLDQRRPDAPERADERGDHVPVSDPIGHANAGVQGEDRRVAFERAIDQLRDLLLQGTHDSDPNRGAGGEQA